MWTASGPPIPTRAERPTLRKASYDEIAELAHQGESVASSCSRDCHAVRYFAVGENSFSGDVGTEVVAEMSLTRETSPQSATRAAYYLQFDWPPYRRQSVPSYGKNVRRSGWGWHQLYMLNLRTRLALVSAL